MKKFLTLIFATLLLFVYSGCGNTLNEGDNIRYEDTLYLMSEWPNYNIALLEDDATSIGDFIQVFDNGYEIPWEVFVLNDQKNVLFSAHALWLKEGYSLPDEYGEDFSKAEYVIAEGILDDYTEDKTFLTNFEAGVKLENIIASQASQLTNPTKHAMIRLHYTAHANMVIDLYLYQVGTDYYLSVMDVVDGEVVDVYYEINEDYVGALTSQFNA